MVLLWRSNSIAFAFQKDRFWTAKGVSLDSKSIGLEKLPFFLQKVNFLG
jgi:hypothetical protein